MENGIIARTEGTLKHMNGDKLMIEIGQEKPEREERPERSERPRRNNREQNRRVERDADNNEFSYVMPTSFEEATTSLADLFKQLDD